MKRLLRKLIPVDVRIPSDLPRAIVAATGYYRLRTWLGARGERIPDMHLYRPFYSPWLGEPAFEQTYQAIRPYTLLSRNSAYVLWQTLQQARHLDGDCVECGVFRGGTALLAARTLVGSDKKLHLFDSFEGMPAGTDEKESFVPGDFGRTSLEAVTELLAPYPRVRLHPGFIPDTFRTAELDRIAWAHVDVDLYRSVTDCIDWIYPRLVPGAILIFDDYGFPGCAGARRAVDEAFADKPERPLCLPSGQCLIVRVPSR